MRDKIQKPSSKFVVVWVPGGKIYSEHRSFYAAEGTAWRLRHVSNPQPIVMERAEWENGGTRPATETMVVAVASL